MGLSEGMDSSLLSFVLTSRSYKAGKALPGWVTGSHNMNPLSASRFLSWMQCDNFIRQFSLDTTIAHHYISCAKIGWRSSTLKYLCQWNKLHMYTFTISKRDHIDSRLMFPYYDTNCYPVCDTSMNKLHMFLVSSTFGINSMYTMSFHDKTIDM